MKLAIEKSKEPSGVLYEHYGDVLYKNGDKSGALKMWKKAAELGDDVSDDLRKKIETGVCLNNVYI